MFPPFLFHSSMATLAPSRMLTPRLALSPVSGPTNPRATVFLPLVEPPSALFFLLSFPPQAPSTTSETRTATPRRPTLLRPRSIVGLLPSVTNHRSLFPAAGLNLRCLPGLPGRFAGNVLFDGVDGEEPG